MKRVFIPLILSALALSSCTKTVTPQAEKTEPTTVVSQNPTGITTDSKVDVMPATNNPDETVSNSYTIAEIATHKNGLSCWLILDWKVYDVTKFIREHTSDAILRGCGKDATQMFSKHSESAREMKEKFYIGDLKL